MPKNYQEQGETACKYAREQIREGSTQLINNEYDLNKKIALRKALRDVRKAANESKFLINIDNTIRKFEHKILHSSKLSIGNCHELALMALHYFLNNHPTTSAEVYYIDGGDHAFLVIGRKVGSDPSKPETWGEDSFICDPWSNKVYPATEYLQETKNFYSITELPQITCCRSTL